MNIPLRYRAWIIWLLGALFMFYKYALEVSPSVMAPYLIRDFNINALELGNLAATYFYAYLLLQIPAGLLIDKVGARIATTCAITLCALGTLIFARADSLMIASMGRFLTGMGAAFSAISCLKMIANWFPAKKFSFMVGLMMTMAMLGAVGGQAPLAAFIDAFDWRQSLQILGLAGLALGLFFWLIVRNKAPHHDLIPVASPHLLISLLKILKTPACWWLSIYSGLAFAPVMVFGGLWGVSFLEAAFGLTPLRAAQSVSLIFIGFALGAPLFGWLSNILGKKRPIMFLGTFLALLSISIVIYLPVLPPIIIAALLFFFGFFISTFLLSFSMIADISSLAMAATAIGFMNTFNALIGAFSDPFSGKLLDLNWDGQIYDGIRIFSVEAYQIAFLAIPLYLIIALFLLIRIKESRPKESTPGILL